MGIHWSTQKTCCNGFLNRAKLSHLCSIAKDQVTAFYVLLRKTCFLQVPLQVAPPLDSNLLNGLKLGLEGEHQYINAGLAVALSSKWLQRTGHLEISYLEQTVSAVRVSLCKLCFT